MRGGALMNEINSLIKQTPMNSCLFCHVRKQGRRGGGWWGAGGAKTNVYNRKVDSYQALIFALILSSQPPELREINVCFETTQSMHSYYNSLHGLRPKPTHRIPFL